MEELDLLDRKILYELDLNTRIPAAKLARKLKKSKETVTFRINRLVKNGIIKGFYAITNTSKFGLFYYKVYLKFKNLTTDKADEILDYVHKQEHIAFLASVEGYYDSIFVVMVKQPEDMMEFMDPFMKKFGDYIQEKEILTLLSSHRLNQRFLYAGDKHVDVYYEVKLESYELDDIDKKILNVLSKDSRQSLISIAKEINQDSKLVAYRLRKLERNKIILAYVTSTDIEKLGYQFIQINISLKDPTSRRKIIKFFDSTNKSPVAIELLGKYDLTVELYVKTNEELKSIINQFRDKFVNEYNYYDILTVRKEYKMVWRPVTY